MCIQLGWEYLWRKTMAQQKLIFTQFNLLIERESSAKGKLTA